MCVSESESERVRESVPVGHGVCMCERESCM